MDAHIAGIVSFCGLLVCEAVLVWLALSELHTAGARRAITGGLEGVLCARRVARETAQRVHDADARIRQLENRAGLSIVRTAFA